ncbi:MAG: AraC family transcriptional regulator [Gemmatimonadaceae bacterium]|nr:AraC family transcriptional regulator [Gemmatimonadaceae bacterium]MCW5826865.1 AraC family transcriptional regulator [Gemmatimonadaceae bacterium]
MTGAIPFPFPVEGTVLAAVVADVIAAAESLGVPRAELLTASGLDAAVLADPDARVPVTADFAVWLALSNRPIGLPLGEKLGATTLGAVGYAMQHGRTVREALQWFQRYRAVLHPELVPEMDEVSTSNGRRLVLSKVMAGPFARLREPVYAYASAARALLRGLTGAPVAVRSLSYPFPSADDAAAHEAWFGCRITWGAPRFEIAFDAAVLDRPLPRHDPRLFGYLAQQAERLLEEVPDSGSTLAMVRREIAAELPSGEPQQGVVAKRLAMSVRTMQRRLAAEGTTFAALVEAMRRERAEFLLSDPRLTASEVAFLLGFSEPASFFRAFRRWTGEPPQRWRAARR